METKYKYKFLEHLAGYAALILALVFVLVFGVVILMVLGVHL